MSIFFNIQRENCKSDLMHGFEVDVPWIVGMLVLGTFRLLIV